MSLEQYLLDRLTGKEEEIEQKPVKYNELTKLYLSILWFLFISIMLIPTMFYGFLLLLVAGSLLLMGLIPFALKLHLKKDTNGNNNNK